MSVDDILTEHETLYKALVRLGKDLCLNKCDQCTFSTAPFAPLHCPLDGHMTDTGRHAMHRFVEKGVQ